MLIIALEGPSYAGKSTAIRHLRRTALGSRAFVSDCYVRHIALRDDIPPARTDSAAAQLDAFERFMEIEATRLAEAAASGRQLVILDRSVDTLLAHAYALDALFGYGVRHQLHHRLKTLPFLRPDHTLYLDVPAETLHLRRKTAGHTTAKSEYFLHEPRFLRHARDYFVHTPRRPVTRELTVLAADAGPADVARAVEALVTFWAR
ncbi:AAA family ATPase [Streptomyces sp. OfavH-34-F]|uniref:AAA family ATPase n=1 Tax=Streptomyces sp. OfavH-34-F TaxID=2917760 RepID=UPI001EF25A82|nr:AAA family ATPase [Streptomyces sp. OfavH-34-F]MCG7523366.1 AAA family ATPase [Streptomyces sp. OfavH-34-F]